MQLSEFLNSLFREGRVTVVRALAAFDAADLEASAHLIAKFWRSERLEMPAELPGLHKDAELAAQYLYPPSSSSCYRT